MCNCAAMSVGETPAPSRTATIAARSSAFSSEPFAISEDKMYMQYAAAIGANNAAPERWDEPKDLRVRVPSIGNRR
jgi:hypothetical protein